MKLTLLSTLLLAPLVSLHAAEQAESLYSYPTDAVPVPFGPQGQIYSTLTME